MNIKPLSRVLRTAAFLAAATFAMFTVSAANAQTATKQAPAMVASETASHVDLTIYAGRYAQVEETRVVQLAAGHNRVQLNGIASKYRNDSLRIISANGPGSFTYVSAVYQPANMSKEKLLQSAIGQKVQLRDESSIVTGTLVSYNNGQLVVTDDNGHTGIYSDNRPIVVPTPSGLSNSSSLVVEADVAKEGLYTISFLYETDGITWQAKHSAIYDEAQSKFSSFESTVSLVNQSGTSFQNATVWLLTSSAASTREESAGRSYMLAAAAAPAPGGADIHSASAENVGDAKAYKLPGEINLTDGQSRLVPLFSSSDVGVKREYFISENQYYSDVSEVAPKRSVNVRLNVQNTDKEHLGLPIPAGVVKVYQTNSAGNLQLVGAASLGHVSKDEPFSINIGTASDIKMQTKITGVKTFTGVNPHNTANPPEFQDSTYQITVFNYKTNEDVAVTLQMAVPSQLDDITPLVRDSAESAHTTIQAAKNATGSVEFTLRTQTR